ncbi:MAG: YsnF/AvaK domain-containing protein [Acetobacteraceae bacterium]|nr:YsnF/AvaK domain-containing protein [Acetobacteraceae bacterium]
MPNETIVAVFDSSTRADAAVRALESAGVPSAAIERHNTQSKPTNEARPEPRGAGSPMTGFLFWDMMMSAPSTHEDRSHFERSIERGETVVAVTVSAQDAETVTAILEEHSPVELDDRTEENQAADTERVGRTETSERASRGLETEARRQRSEREEVIPLAEEELRVGKRTVNRGRSRVRRYVVETPVEQTVSLKDERVVLERRRPEADEPTDDAFRDKTIEVTETSEIPVTEKVARLKEEIVVRKQQTERNETVRDTVRRDQIAVEEAEERPEPRRRSNA